MHILQINNVDTKGGAAKVAYSLKTELEKRSHETSMFVARKYSKDKNIFLLNDSQKFINKVQRKLSYWLANDVDFFNSDKILEAEEFKKADIIHCHNLHSYYFNLSTLEKISNLKPIIWTFHDMWPITAHCAHAFDGKLKENGFFTCPSLDIYPPIAWHNEKHLEKRKKDIYNNSNFHIVTPSQWLADKVKQSVLRDKPLTVIHNGVDANIFRQYPKEESRQELNLPLDKKVVLSIVKKPDDQWKGWGFVDKIIKHYENNKNILFINIGRNFKNRDNFINIPPIGDEKKLAKYYSAADVLLYPSIADNCPLAVLEASACGLPIVAFKTGGIPEIIEHKKTGYIAEYKNADDLAQGLKYMLNLDIHSLNQMSHATAQKIRQSFTLEIMTAKYIDLYKSFF